MIKIQKFTLFTTKLLDIALHLDSTCTCFGFVTFIFIKVPKTSSCEWPRISVDKDRKKERKVVGKEKEGEIYCQTVPAESFH